MLGMITHKRAGERAKRKDESKPKNLETRDFTLVFHLFSSFAGVQRLTGLVSTPVRLLSVVIRYGRLVCQYLPVESNQ